MFCNFLKKCVVIKVKTYLILILKNKLLLVSGIGSSVEYCSQNVLCIFYVIIWWVEK